MGKLVMLIVVLVGLYYIGTNIQSVDVQAVKDEVMYNLENKGAVGAVKRGRAKRQKELMDAYSL